MSLYLKDWVTRTKLEPLHKWKESPTYQKPFSLIAWEPQESHYKKKGTREKKQGFCEGINDQDIYSVFPSHMKRNTMFSITKIVH